MRLKNFLAGLWFKAKKQPKANPALDLINQAITDLQGFSAIANKTPDPDIRQCAARIIPAAGKIINQLHQYPQQLGRLRRYLSYYLATALNLMVKYQEISSHGHLNTQAKPLQLKITHNLNRIADVFEKQFLQIIEQELTELDCELEVLDKSLKTE